MPQHIILIDSDHTRNLWPLTATRPIAELRVGILSISDKWRKYFGAEVTHYTTEYLSKKYPLHLAEDNFIIDGSVLPNEELIYLLNCLNNNQWIMHHDQFVAARLTAKQVETYLQTKSITNNMMELINCNRVHNLWDIFTYNDLELRNDYQLLTKDKISQQLNKTNTILGDQIFIEAGAKINCAILNSETGPIFIDKDAEIMEGSMIRGPFYLGEKAQVKMGAKIYGATTIGPSCKVGGEVHNAVFYANSNKSHDGYIGNAVIGEWCNIGADTNSSNLKNNYEQVKVWSYAQNKFAASGTIFCGLMMGDHAKCGINTMFNTGTVVGVGANVFGDGFPRQFIPDFAWGGASGFTTFQLDKFYQTASIVMQRRGITLQDIDKSILEYIYNINAPYRSWEKSNS